MTFGWKQTLAIVHLGLACGVAAAPPAQAGSSRSSGEQPSAGSSLGAAVKAIRSGDFAGADKILQVVLKKKPTSADAHYYRGVALQNLDKGPGALKHYRQALALKPEFLEASLNLTAALLDLGNAAEALPVIDTSLKSQAKHPGLLYNRAIALAQLGREQEAASAFEVASKAAPEDDAIRFGHAEARMRTGETGVARELLLKLSQSNDPAVLASTARLLGRLKEFDACVQALNKALAQQIAAELLVARGLCQHGRGKDVAALEDFEHAQQQDESFAAAHYYVGMHWKQAGEPGKAKKALERTVELAGDAGIGRAARRALGRL